MEEINNLNNIEKIKEDRLLKEAISFLEYEEALTKDAETASRIRTMLKLLGVWN